MEYILIQGNLRHSNFLDVPGADVAAVVVERCRAAVVLTEGIAALPPELYNIQCRLVAGPEHDEEANIDAYCPPGCVPLAA